MRRSLAAILGLVLLTTLVPASAQETLEDARARREALQAEAAQTAAEIDILEAEDADIVAAVEQIDAWIMIQEAQLDRARQDLASTLEAEAQARTDAATLEAEIGALRDTIAEQSVNAYIQGFTTDDEILLGADDINSVPILRYVLDESSGVSSATTDLLRVALDHQRTAIADAEEAAAATRELQADIEVRLAALEASRSKQNEIRQEIDRRIEDLEAAADILAAEDRQVEQFIRDEIARIAAEEERRREAEAARLAEEQRLAEEEAQAAADEAAAAEAEPETAGDDTGTDDAETPEPGADADEAPGAEEPAPGEDSTDPAETGAGAESDTEATETGADDTVEPASEEPPEEPAPPPQPDPNATPTFIRPVPGGVSSGFGNRVHPVYGTVRLHAGLDYHAAQGTPIGASAPGTVIFAGTFSGYGNTVVVQHTGGYSTLYAHMSAFNVSAGATVSAGDVVGLVGSTGLSTGPHLHFEIRLNGTAIDPAPFL